MPTTHAFHLLLPQQVSSLRHRALKLSANPQRAEDLVQETLLKAWTNRETFQPGSNLRAWLFTILRNTFFSEQRKYRWEVEDVDNAAARTLTDPPRQEDAVALRELMTALEALPATQRKPIVLIGAFGYSQLEAADSCGCAVGTIKSRVSRGRTLLSRTLGNEQVLVAEQPEGVRSAKPRQPQGGNCPVPVTLTGAARASRGVHNVSR